VKKIDPTLLESVRLRCRCERCRKRGPVDPHHVFARGMGGAGRLDLPENLIALCRWCHDAFHAGNIKRAELLDLVAVRERTTVDAIVAKIHRWRRARSLDSAGEPEAS
jgi:hypothetical protein